MTSFVSKTACFQLCEFLVAFLGWCLCLTTTSIRQWRLWNFENTTTLQSGTMWIGIWEVCYDTSYSESGDYEMTCKHFDAGHIFLPKEIFIAQDLMSLCAVVDTLALGFIFFVYWNIFKNGNEKEITFTFFTIGGFLSFISGIMVLIPVTWNMVSVLNNNKINFPASFDVPSSNPKSQSVGVAIYFGFVSAFLQIVSGLLFLSYKYLLIHKKTHPLDPGEGSDISIGESSESCPRCGSSLNISTSGHYTRFCEGGRKKKRQGKPEVTFHIPMGPIPEQRVAHSDHKTFGIDGDAAYFYAWSPL